MFENATTWSFTANGVTHRLYDYSGLQIRIECGKRLAGDLVQDFLDLLPDSIRVITPDLVAMLSRLNTLDGGTVVLVEKERAHVATW